MDLAIGFAVGLVVGAFVATLYARSMIKLYDNTPNVGAFALMMLMGGVLLFAVGPTWAQTPVPLVIPTNTIFTEANNWITIFAPIAAIGIGITIALAVLGYLGKMIAGAFRN
jgi:hypothetical protein